MTDLLDRLTDRTIFDETVTGCWLWQGSLTKPAPDGYGQVRSGGVMEVVHRVGWRLLRGPLPDGLVPDHLCRTRNCWNPEHIEWVSPRENIIRGVSPTARHAAQTHCKRGHPLSGNNLRMVNRGKSRKCVTCMLRERAEYIERRRHRG